MAAKKILLCNCPDLKVDLAAVVTELASQQVESVVLEPCCTPDRVGPAAGDPARMLRNNACWQPAARS